MAATLRQRLVRLTDQFHRRSLKLAGVYLAIIMTISIFFSAMVFQLSTQELSRGLRGPGPGGANGGNGGIGVIERGPESLLPQSLRDAIAQDRQSRYEEARSRVLNRLVVINLFILVGAGVLSYYFAARTLKPIEEANAALERFTADASHELRTPLAAMRSEIEVALMNPDLKLPEAKHILESNLEELEKLTALSEGLLKLARQDAGHFRRERVAIDDIIQAAVDKAAPLAQAKQIKLRLPQPSNLHVTGDSVSLAEVLFILLDNAIKYSPTGKSVKIEFSQKQKQAVIQVADQGIGIRASELPHIFERFYRADKSRASRSEGAAEGYGIGLALAKHIVELHGGTISVQSQSGVGSVFAVALPSTL